MRPPFAWLVTCAALALFVCNAAKAGSAAEHAHNVAPVGTCGDIEIGPLPADRYPGPEAWQKVLEPLCPLQWSAMDEGWHGVAALCTASSKDMEPPTHFRNGRQERVPRECGLLALLHLQQHEKRECTETNCNQRFPVNIPAGPLVTALQEFSVQTGCQITANFGDLELKDRPAPAIVGAFRAKKLIRMITKGTSLVPRWEGCDTVHVVPRNLPHGEGGVTDMLVTSTRLGSLQGSAPKVTVLDREQIDRTGASSIPEVLQHLSQTAFQRGLGFRTSGAQYAELRGLGAEFTKVLINGRPTFGTAADMFEGGFDLNVVPLSAVERIEITLDAVSLAHGADAIGGTLNIVLRESSDELAEARYEGANDGGSVYRASVIGGFQTETGSASLIMDYSRTTPLFGADRDRWRNADWRQHGGSDHRALNSAPPNIRSLDGQPLPGLSSSFAAVTVPSSGAPIFRGDEQNLTSLLAWQSIVPDIRRTSLSAIGHRDIGSTSLSSELLVSHRSVLYQFGPAVISELTLGAQHPENPFGVPVAVSAALTGLPLEQQETESTYVRGILAATGAIGSRGTYETFLLHTSDSADVTTRNTIDPLRVMEGLSDNPAVPFDIISAAPGEGGHSHFLAPERTITGLNGATQFTARASGPVWHLPAGISSADLGFEARREFAKFTPLVDRVHRDVFSGYGSLKVPLTRGLSAEYGVRRDSYEDVSAVTSHQYVIRFRHNDFLRIHASHSDSFDPPDFWQLKSPRTVVRGAPIFDPKRNEVIPITVITGGNEDLRPAIGRASSLGIRIGAEDSSFVSLSLWHVELEGRNSLLPPFVLLAHEDTAITGRIVRETPNDEDLANGRVGRLSLLDITRANFGKTTTRGFDFTLGTRFETSFGSIFSRFDASYTDQFRFADLPIIDAPLRERTGRVDVYGTITDWRVRGALSYTQGDWVFSLLGRYNSCYDDFDLEPGQSSMRTICPGLGLDANVTKELSEHVRLTLGVSDVYTSSVPFASTPAGFDMSQRDLAGPRGYAGIAFKL